MRWLDPASPGSWVTPAFDDSSWSTGVSPLGYGPDLAWGTTVADNSLGTGYDDWWSGWGLGGSWSTSAQAFYYFRVTLCLAADAVSQVRGG